MNLSARLFSIACGLGTACVLVSCATPKAQSPDAGARFGAWSNPVNGLRGRLIITDLLNTGEPSRRRLDGDRSFCIYLELQNVSPNSYAVAWEFPYTMESAVYALALTDRAGNVIPREKSLIGYDAYMVSEWIRLPPETQFRFLVTSAIYEHPRGEPDTSAFVSLGMDQPWRVVNGPAQSYFLRGTFTPQASEEYSNRPNPPSDRRLHMGFTTWRGTLDLPPVAIPPRSR
jgi:hypothetical protein